MNLGFRVLKRNKVASKALVEAFAKLPVANVSDSMGRMTAGGPNLRRMNASGGMSGVAVTVKSRPGDNLMLHWAIDISGPGDVIVVDAGGDLTNAIFGEMMLAYAIKRGVAGLVINGAIRDADEIREVNHPVYAAGVTHRGPYKDGPGEINVPISICGMVVNPGDIIIGDGDGVLCVPQEEAAGVLELAKAKQAAEAKQMQAIAEGKNDRSWVKQTLDERGCAFPET